MLKIQTGKNFGVDMVWYLNDDKCAVCCEVEKNEWENSYEIKFKGKISGGFKQKREAIAQCKKVLKHYFYTGKIQLWI